MATTATKGISFLWLEAHRAALSQFWPSWYEYGYYPADSIMPPVMQKWRDCCCCYMPTSKAYAAVHNFHSEKKTWELCWNWKKKTKFQNLGGFFALKRFELRHSIALYKDCRLSPVEALSITPTLLFPEYVTSTDTLASQWVTLHFPGRGNKSRENFIHLFAWKIQTLQKFIKKFGCLCMHTPLLPSSRYCTMLNDKL